MWLVVNGWDCQRKQVAECLVAVSVSLWLDWMPHRKISREMPVSFSEDLTGNMRTLKPKGSLLLERFDSLHKRNLIQVNGPKSTRKRKVRIIEAKK